MIKKLINQSNTYVLSFQRTVSFRPKWARTQYCLHVYRFTGELLENTRLTGNLLCIEHRGSL